MMLRISSQGGQGVVILENSPVGESQSNGMVENAIKEVQWQIRKLKEQLEKHVQCKIEYGSPIWPWLVQYAGQLIYTHKIFKTDGRSVRQRIIADPTLPDQPYFW